MDVLLAVLATLVAVLYLLRRARRALGGGSEGGAGCCDEGCAKTAAPATRKAPSPPGGTPGVPRRR